MSQGQGGSGRGSRDQGSGDKGKGPDPKGAKKVQEKPKMPPSKNSNQVQFNFVFFIFNSLLSV